MSNLFEELKRRKVFRVAAVYAVVAWLLIQITDVILPTFNAPQWVNQVVILLLFLGFPVAVVLAWALELTPAGLKVDPNSSNNHDESITNSRNPLILVGGIAAGLALTGFVTLTIINRDQSQVDSPLASAPIEKSIAVLPFVAMSSGEEDGYFADGLTEELLNSLAQLSDLRVAARTSSFFYKGKDQDLREIGSALGVAHVLEGSVRRSGNNIRVTAQLVEAEGGFHLWSETYDRNFTEIFSIQDDIANQVTDALRVELLGEELVVLEDHGTDNPEAQRLYLIARARLRELSRLNYNIQGDPVPAGRMRALFEQATQLDPTYADAWAGLAEAILLLGRNGLTENSGILLTQDDAIAQAEAAIEQARTFAPESIATLQASALLSYRQYSSTRVDRTAERLNEVLAAYDRVLELDSENSFALEELARVHWDLENYEQSRDLYDQVIAIDPLSPALIESARSYFPLDPAEGMRRAKRASDLFPETGWQFDMGMAETIRGHFHHAEVWFNNLQDPTPYLGGPIHTAISLSLGFDTQVYDRISDYTGIVGGELGNIVDFNSAIYRGEYESVVEAILQNSDNIESFDFSQLIPSLFRLRRFDEAVEQLHAAYARRDTSLEQRIQSAFLTSGGVFYEISHLLEVTGDQRRAEQIRQVIREQVHSRRNLDNFNDRRLYLEGELLLLASEGRVEEALDTFEQLVDSGWRWLVSPSINATKGEMFSVNLFRFEDNPILDSIRNEARFVETLNYVKAQNAEMREALEAGLSLDDIIEDH